MKKLIILGAGGFGREIETYVQHKYKGSKEWKLIGFIDDNPNALDNKKNTVNILGAVDTYSFKVDEYVIIAIADPKTKEIIYNKLNKRNVNILTFIAENVFVGLGVKFGIGCVICPNTILPNNSVIGKMVTININSTIGHDTVIGDFTSIMPSVNIGGETTINGSVFIGTGSNIAPRINVIEGTFIGMGTNVISNISLPGTYFGNPARKMK